MPTVTRFKKITRTVGSLRTKRSEVFIYKSRKYATDKTKLSSSSLLRFPVRPMQALTSNTANPFTRENVLGRGEVTIFTGDELRTLEMGEMLWPAVYDESFCISKPTKTPKEAAALIQQWKDQKSPVRVVIAYHSHLNMDCTIEDLVIDFERPGHIGDAWLTFKLVEYKAPSIRKTKVTTKKVATKKPSSKGKSSKSRSKAKKPKTPPTYVVKRNDTLGAIAKRYYGSADYKYYNAIYNANKAEFSKWHKRYRPRSRFTIYPTMKLKIPKKP